MARTSPPPRRMPTTSSTRASSVTMWRGAGAHISPPAVPASPPARAGAADQHLAPRRPVVQDGERRDVVHLAQQGDAEAGRGRLALAPAVAVAAARVFVRLAGVDDEQREARGGQVEGHLLAAAVAGV